MKENYLTLDLSYLTILLLLCFVLVPSNAAAAYNPVKYVIFDMDGLLLDTETLHTKVYKEILGRYGAIYTEEMHMRIMGTVEDNFLPIFINEYKLPVSLEALKKEVRAEEMKNMQNVQLLRGVEKLVTHLKKNNIPIAVATSSNMEQFEMKTQNLTKLFSLFDHIVAGGSDPEVKRGKPAPDIFLVCASRFPEKPSPNECLVFEDAPNGVEGAVKAGMQVVMVPDSLVPQEKRKLATKVISSLLEFKPEEFGLPKYGIE